METKKVGVILVATGIKYHKYIIPQITSIKENFKPSDDVTIFLFTDAKYKYIDKQFSCEDLGYPGATLWRFDIILKHEDELKKMDYLYYMDIDMMVVGKIGEEVLGDRVATQHPGFINLRGTYENRPESLACVNSDEGIEYYCGGFNGGSSEEYLKMAKQLNANTKEDSRNGVMAIFHDESHMNRYLIDNPPTKVLSPAYCYPEPPEDEKYAKNIWKREYEPKIYALDKERREKMVSIVIPCYEQAQYLHNAIESALNQTYANVEVIVVDDGSPDNASEVAKGYPVTLIRQENKGLPGARNSGIAIADGEYFLPLDADDRIEKDFLMKTVPEMNNPNVGVVYTPMKIMNHKYEIVERPLIPSEKILLENLKHNNQVYVCSLVRMKAVKQCNGYNENMIHGYEDWNFWIDICKRGWEFNYVPLSLFNYMVKSGSMSGVSYYKWHKFNTDQLKKNHPEIYGTNE